MTSQETIEKHDHYGSPKTCRVCKSSYCQDCHPSLLGICERCAYKILIGLVCVFVVISYVWWFGVF